MFPIQDAENIPEWLAQIVYKLYRDRYGDQQSYERIRERGGFGAEEILYYLSDIPNEKTAKAIKELVERHVKNGTEGFEKKD